MEREDWFLDQEAYDDIVKSGRIIIDRIKEFPHLLDQLCFEIEVALIRIALDRNKGNRTSAAKMLGIKRTTLVEKIRRYKGALEELSKSNETL